MLDSQAGEARVIYGRPFFRATADYETVARMLKDTLVLARDEGTQVFLGLTAVMRSKLSIGERKWFAWAALVSLDSEDAWDVMERVRSGEESAGRPQMPFLDIEEEANDWAARASLQELWAYALACLTQLSPKMRGALWRLVGRKLGP